MPSRAAFRKRLKTSSAAGSASQTSTGRLRWFPTRRPLTGRCIRHCKARDRGGKDAFQADYLLGALVVPPGARKGVDAHLYAGAKQATLIDGYESALDILRFDRMIDWGWFYFITRPLFQLMEFINGIVHNFGVTILILTVLVKAAFFPLANKQYESMARMKKLQPEMQRIKELHKDDAAAPAERDLRSLQKGEDQSARRLLAGPAADPRLLRAL